MSNKAMNYCDTQILKMFVQDMISKMIILGDDGTDVDDDEHKYRATLEFTNEKMEPLESL